MLNKIFLHDLAVKNETSSENIAREYVQHLFLRSFYSKEKSQNFLFKGGTALRIAFGSPRFSQDLDFTGVNNGGSYEKVLEETIYDLSGEGLNINLLESKSTTGGYLANIEVGLSDEIVEIKNQISFRDNREKADENIVIVSNFVPSYNIFLLDRAILVNEKAKALIERAKPRDFFDLYYILRHESLRKVLKLDLGQREKIIKRIISQDKKRLETELKNLLPKSFLRVIEDLPGALKKEMGEI